jgi:uroporphyrinogen decarboxylase
MSLPIMLMGMEKWMELLFMGPGDIRELLLEKCFDFFVKEITACKNAGADILVYSNPFGSTDMVPMKYFLESCLPWIQKEIKAVGPDGMVYYCGTARFNKVIDTIINTTDFKTFYLSPLDDIAQAKQIIAGRGLTCGVINDIRLIDWSETQIQNEVKKMIAQGMPGGKFLFGTGVMPYNIPEKKIKIMLDTAYEYGCFK